MGTCFKTGKNYQSVIKAINNVISDTFRRLGFCRTSYMEPFYVFNVFGVFLRFNRSPNLLQLFSRMLFCYEGPEIFCGQWNLSPFSIYMRVSRWWLNFHFTWTHPLKVKLATDCDLLLITCVWMIDWKQQQSKYVYTSMQSEPGFCWLLHKSSPLFQASAGLVTGQ